MAPPAIPTVEYRARAPEQVVPYPCHCGCGIMQTPSSSAVKELRINGRLREKPSKQSSRKIYFVGAHYVVKTEGGRQNKGEAQAWERIKGTPDAEFFAEVVYISEDFTVLIQRRVRFKRPGGMEPSEKEATAQAQDIARRLGIRDMHYGNFGIAPNGKPIIFDYAL